MTNTASATYVLTACPDHGTKECADYASSAHYVDVIRVCHHDRDRAFHLIDHASEGSDCWSCCSKMEIDPENKF